jgi:hypothetical protein
MRKENGKFDNISSPIRIFRQQITRRYFKPVLQEYSSFTTNASLLITSLCCHSSQRDFVLLVDGISSGQIATRAKFNVIF